jgi:hypothetical protein
MAEPHVCVAAAGALFVDGEEVRRKAHRPASLRVQAHPTGDRLDRAALAADRGPAFGREAADAAAEGAQLEVLPEARERLHPDARAPHDPDAAPLEAGIDQVRIGDVLQPSGHRVEPATAGAIRVRDPGPHLALEGPSAQVGR